MGYFDFLKPKPKQEVVEQPSSVVFQGDARLNFGVNYPVVNRNWDGEKTLGELGAVVNNIPNYDNLRMRSYDAYATKDIVKIIASKHFYWTIGSGLKLQCEPNRTVLESEGLSGFDFGNFAKFVESRFMVYANSKQCDNLKEKNLHELGMDFYKGKFIGADCLCVIRYDDNGPNAQFISGSHVQNPTIGSKYYDSVKESNNRIEHGIEVDERGKHVAYYVNVKPKSNDLLDEYERIPAYGVKSGKRLAWMVSGEKISPDHMRAVPAISQSLEKINKLDQFMESSVLRARESANIVYTVIHDKDSTGESPTDKIISDRRGQSVLLDLPSDKVLADGLANKITETTSGQAFNMTPGSKLESFSTDIGTDFQAFYTPVFDTISAGMDIPPEVAMQKYSSNYSASRAAINSFGYIVSINRMTFANQFYIPFYKLWLEFQILTNKIEAKGYIENIDNFMVTESYSQCRFIGKNMPHIDPLKEIKAVREMLGIDDNSPLISREQATELLNMGQWDENFMKSLEEAKIIPKEVEPKKEEDAN